MSIMTNAYVQGFLEGLASGAVLTALAAWAWDRWALREPKAKPDAVYRLGGE